MPLDPEVAAVLDAQRGLPPRSSLTIEQTRERMRAAAALGGEPPDIARVEDLRVAGVPVRSYSPAECAPTVVYFHGGRFFSGDLDTHDTVCRHLAVASGCQVVAVDYRLAPEHRFPAAVEDACKVVGSLGPHVAVAGDSAGANLAAVAAQVLRTVRCQLLIYPMIDATCGQPSHIEFASGYGPGSEDMRRGWNEYLPASHDPCDPLASPFFAQDLTGLPPALIVTAEYDPLRDEGERFGGRMAEAGVDCRIRRYDGTIHGFLQMTGVLEVARRAVQDCAEYLRDRCSQ